MELRVHEGLLLPYPREDVFPFFASAENLDALTPPWLHFSITTPLPIEMAAGARIGYRIRLHGIPIRWESEITEWTPPHGFTDVQRRGPYRSWVHRHTSDETPDGTLVTDDVSYRVLGGSLVNRLFVAGQLRRIFAYRKAKLQERFPS